MIVTFNLTDKEAAALHYAVWLAYGNDAPGVLWIKLRQGFGKEWEDIVWNSGKQW